MTAASPTNRPVTLLGSFLVALFAALVGIGAQPAPATIGVNDYPSNLASAAKDSLVDPWGFYNRECTSFVAWRMNHDNGVAFTNGMGGGHWGNAYEWWGNASTLGYARSSTPAVGSIAYWSANYHGASSFGHVSYVKAINADGSIDTEDYNATNTGMYSTHHYTSRSGSWPYGFIHVQDLGGGTTTYNSASGDFNGDGAADLVLRDTTSGIIYIRFGPTFVTQITYQWAARTNFQFFTGDFDNSGADDLALRDTGSGTIYMRHSSATGFGGQTTFAWAPGTYFQSLAGDYNGDGYADLVLRDTGSGMIYIRFGPGYGAQITYGWASGTYFQILSGDFDASGADDLVLRDTGGGMFYLRYSSANGFGGQTTYAWAPGTYFQSLVGDFNNDGYDELVLRDKGSGMFYIRYAPSFANQSTYYWPATG